MLDAILTADQQELLRDERRLLTDAEAALQRWDVSEQDRETLAGSVRQLDELFLLVVVGEFNAGKSALINALLGARVLTEGVTPTTAEIHLVTHGDRAAAREREDGVRLVQAPAELLRQLTIVDTPGTNALERRHEAITEEFVPRSDLVLFVTSADRPFSESERGFLERIRRWGKKVVLVVNKVDILEPGDAVAEVERYVRTHGGRLLGVDPPVFPVSAKRAVAATEPAGRAASGLPALEEWLERTLDDAERIRLKLRNPLGVADGLLRSVDDTARGRLELLREDVRTLDDIDRQLEQYAGDVEREFRLRLAEIDGILLDLENRGVDFFDEHLRLGRIRELFDREALRRRFETEVVGDLAATVEGRVEDLIDWLVASNLNQWQAVVQHVQRRRSHHEGRLVGEVGGRFEYDRAGMLEAVGNAARRSLERYDRGEEARRLAEDVQRAVAGTALVEVGAVGLGATVALIASGTVADATGLAAAGLLAVVGLFILPHRRRRAKAELKAAIAAMRREIGDAVGDQFRRQASAGLQRIRDTVAPYTRFVRSEREQLDEQRSAVADLRRRIEELAERVEGV